jgi:cation diffusion facilitator family transporter
VVDPSIATTARGIWAVKWSFAILAITAAAQLVVVALSGSVALLADTIHNMGDAGTAIPLWIALALARRPPSPRFTYGYGRVEDLAGVIIVGIILFSAIVAGWEAVDRLLEPRPIPLLGWVAAAGVIGFLGNEAVAVFRIRVGRAIASAALVADGYHARVDGLTSLAVVRGVLGVWLGFPLADTIVGLIITAMIFGIVWQSAKAVFTRLLDGVHPQVIAELRHAAEHVPGIAGIESARARWVGHRLHARPTLWSMPSCRSAKRRCLRRSCAPRRGITCRPCRGSRSRPRRSAPTLRSGGSPRARCTRTDRANPGRHIHLLRARAVHEQQRNGKKMRAEHGPLGQGYLDAVAAVVICSTSSSC